MIRSQLRIYCGPETSAGETVLSSLPSPSRRVTVSAGELFAALADAVQHQRAWLSDFADDDVTISGDLYDVVQAYLHHLRPSA